MTDSLIREIADKVVQEAILQNWKLYAVLIALTLVSAVANAFLSKYFEIRAETYATKSDLNEVLRQLRQTTEVAEQVRTAVSHADWLAREWKTIRRTKLEELVQSAIAVEQWLNHQRSVWFFQKEQEHPSPPTDHVAMLAALYFPELVQQSASLTVAQSNALTWIVNTGLRALNAGGVKEKGALLTEVAPEWNPLYKSVKEAIHEIKKKASEVMAETRGA